MMHVVLRYALSTRRASPLFHFLRENLEAFFGGDSFAQLFRALTIGVEAQQRFPVRAT
jgi:hypothetical protein